jgi:alpha-ribazole phosphatase
LNNNQTAQLHAGEYTLYLLRHGEIATPGILAGKTDVSLSERGQKQVAQVTDSLKNIDRCITSPLVRCHERASAYCQQQSLPLEIESKIQEMNFGDWDGQSYQALWKMDEQSATCTIGDFWQNPWQNQPPNGETMDNFVSRVDNWWQDFCAQTSLQNTLVFTHAGVIKHLLARVLNLPIPGTVHMASIDVPYASLIKISLYRDESGKVWSKLVL